jgi:hypothetical protein
MANPLFVKDHRVLWLQVPKVGTPAAWEAGKNYKIGDTVVPTAPPAELADKMFQCVGFLGKSGTSEPVFPNVLGNTVIDNNIIWKARDPELSPEALDKNEYCLIDEVIVVTS